MHARADGPQADGARAPLIIRWYLPALTFFAGLNGIRAGSFGVGVLGEALLVSVVAFTLSLYALLRLRVSFPPSVAWAAALLALCAGWSGARGDTRLASSIALLLCSFLVLRRWVHDRRFLYRYMYFWPLVIGVVFYAVYLALPGLVYAPEEGGKYVSVGPLNLLRFEGSTLNANAYGLAMVPLLFSLVMKGERPRRLLAGFVSLGLSFSYSSVFGYLYLIFFKRARTVRRLAVLTILAALIPTYSLVKGWGFSESIRIIKYGHYSAQLLDTPLSGILWGGLDKASHPWVLLSDNTYLSTIYDHGLVFLAVYMVALAILLRRDRTLWVLFLLVNFVVDLHYFWLANLMFALCVPMMNRTAPQEGEVERRELAPCASS